MRLIDADELKTAFPASENSTPVLIASVRATINHMPTIEQPKSYREGYQAGFKDAQSEQRWIPCSERLPEHGYWLWSAKGGEVQKDFYWDGHWENAEKYGYEVMAWMPLPEPYREEEQDG